jgi:hypothetical protein
MKRSTQASTVQTIRLGGGLHRSLAREARRRRSTKSELVRELLAAGLGAVGVPDLAQARRQSLLVGRRRSERDALEFLEHAADTRASRSVRSPRIAPTPRSSASRCRLANGPGFALPPR